MSELAALVEGLEIVGDVNTDQDQRCANIRHSIRLGHPQARREAPKYERVCLVGSGPSLLETQDELYELVAQGAKVVTVNGSYRWCVEQHFVPSAQVLVDARPENARFIEGPAIDSCLYLLSSQCHPDSWAKVRDRKRTIIWHSVATESEEPEAQILNAFYSPGHWQGVSGGSTVIARAIMLLRMMGYMRLDLFGVDCCYLDARHHAFPQPENNRDQLITIDLTPTRGEVPAQTFTCAPWMVKQFQELLQMWQVVNRQFQWAIHGRGMLAYAFETMAMMPELAPEGETHGRRSVDGL